MLAHLGHSGYARTEIVEMPGQFAVRGGILDVFPPEALRPVRIELIGDTVESLREFDPETQRSTGPVNRVALPPLTEFPSHAHASYGNGNAVGVEDADSDFALDVSAGIAGRALTLFELRDEMLVVLDEPEAIDRAAAEGRERLAADALASDGDVEEASGAPAVVDEEQWRTALDRCQRLLLEQLPLRRGDVEPRTLRVQSTTHYHGQIAAFLAEVRGRITSGQQVLVAAASAG